MITIIIAEDHQSLIDGIKLSLEFEGDITVVGEANDGDELIQLVRKKRPQVVITDIRMPGISGIELIKKVSSINADIKVILMSAFEINGDELNELNYQEHLQKPIRMRELVSTINQILKS